MLAASTACGNIDGTDAAGGENDDGGVSGTSLTQVAKMARLSGWATPKVGATITEYGDAIERIAESEPVDPSTDFGPGPIGYLLGPNGWEIVPASGQLNAGHSRWLMATSARVGRLRGYGDGIVAEVAKGFIQAYLQVNREVL